MLLEKYTLAEVKAVCEKLGIHDEIMELKDGYDTDIAKTNLQKIIEFDVFI